MADNFFEQLSSAIIYYGSQRKAAKALGVAESTFRDVRSGKAGKPGTRYDAGQKAKDKVTVGLLTLPSKDKRAIEKGTTLLKELLPPQIRKLAIGEDKKEERKKLRESMSKPGKFDIYSKKFDSFIRYLIGGSP